MELTKQVCSLELSKKLKELGVKQESYFWWIPSTNPVHPETYLDTLKEYESFEEIQAVSAFTVAELGDMLPQTIKKDEDIYYISPSANGSGLKYMDYTKYENGVGIFLRAYPLVGADTEADARAKMLIYLLENNLITL